MCWANTAKFGGSAATVYPENHIQNIPEQEIFVLPSRKDFFMAVRQAQAIVRGIESMPIYTRTGDKGKTGLFNGSRVSKASPRIEAIGTVDELNATIGVVLSSKYQVVSIKKELIKIQNDLFLIGSILAAPNVKYKIHNTKYFSDRAVEFEKVIDTLTKKLPRLMNFILPGGGMAGSSLHLARTVSRRAERRVVELSKKDPSASSGLSGVLIYLNRLSDLLFTMARFLNFKEGKKETIWRNK